MQIYSLDPPGSNTPMGVCSYDTTSETEPKCSQGVVELGQLWRWLHTVQPRPSLIIVEPFTFRKDDAVRAKIDYTPAEYVGVVVAYCQLNEIPYLRQPASVAVGRTAFYGDGPTGNAKLKKMGVWNPLAVPHGIDALRHMMYYLTFKLPGGDKWLRMLK